MMQLIELFSEEDYNITFASTAARSDRMAKLQGIGVLLKDIHLNESSFDNFIRELNPAVVIFDRFISEEQFGWRVAEQCPTAMRILDTEDLHFLRNARETSVKDGGSWKDASLFTDLAKRELASILRSDLSLIISEYEIQLLQETFKVSNSILYYLPFLVDPISETERRKLANPTEREHFVCVGNLLHSPNVDSVIYLKKEVWPAIRKRLPKAQLHIYGAYAPQQISEMHNEQEGFLIKGWVKDILEPLRNAKFCLAPLRYGAGLKGKILDAMLCGTPVLTTEVGAEGMFGEFDPPGGVYLDSDSLAKDAHFLSTEWRDWLLCQQNGFKILEKRFDKKNFSEAFKKRISELHTNLNLHRNQNFIGQILQHQTIQATKYMSKWIEEKNK